ncbi:MAG TPA: DUF4139 domain-containing protein, partial [bacterium]|nr:DUF4139 domain-containing protein [bacterium]
QVPRAQDIPSDGQFHGMMLARRVFPGTFSYLAVPRLSESVYLQARFVNDGDAPYLPGEINVFNGDDFIGKSRFEGATPGQESRLDLGVDDRVKVERTLSSEETRQGGLFRGDTAYREYAYLIKVENFTRASARIDVVDQVPVSQTAEIKVEMDEVEPRPLPEWEGKGPGLMKWSLDVPPGASREISYKYSVSYPKDREIQGL